MSKRSCISCGSDFAVTLWTAEAPGPPGFTNSAPIRSSGLSARSRAKRSLTLPHRGRRSQAGPQPRRHQRTPGLRQRPRGIRATAARTPGRRCWRWRCRCRCRRRRQSRLPTVRRRPLARGSRDTEPPLTVTHRGSDRVTTGRCGGAWWELPGRRCLAGGAQGIPGSGGCLLALRRRRHRPPSGPLTAGQKVAPSGVRFVGIGGPLQHCLDS